MEAGVVVAAAGVAENPPNGCDDGAVEDGGSPNTKVDAAAGAVAVLVAVVVVVDALLPPNVNPATPAVVLLLSFCVLLAASAGAENAIPNGMDGVEDEAADGDGGGFLCDFGIAPPSNFLLSLVIPCKFSNEKDEVELFADGVVAVVVLSEVVDLELSVDGVAVVVVVALELEGAPNVNPVNAGVVDVVVLSAFVLLVSGMAIEGGAAVVGVVVALKPPKDSKPVWVTPVAAAAVGKLNEILDDRPLFSLFSSLPTFISGFFSSFGTISTKSVMKNPGDILFAGTYRFQFSFSFFSSTLLNYSQ